MTEASGARRRRTRGSGWPQDLRQAALRYMRPAFPQRLFTICWARSLFLIFPGLAIFITVHASNLFGDGVRDALDPKGSR